MKTTTENLSTAQVLNNMFAREGMVFSHPEQWELLAQHVDAHKYWLSRELKREITWDEAVFSWYETVMTPLMQSVDSWEFKNAFPNQTRGDLYLAVSDHWHYLKEQDAEANPDDAARSFIAHYGKGLAGWFSRFLRG